MKRIIAVVAIYLFATSSYSAKVSLYPPENFDDRVGSESSFGMPIRITETVLFEAMGIVMWQSTSIYNTYRFKIVSVPTDTTVWELTTGLPAGFETNDVSVDEILQAGDYTLSIEHVFGGFAYAFFALDRDLLTSINPNIEYETPDGVFQVLKGQILYPMFSVSYDEVIPIPASVWLFGSALGILGWIRRKKVS
jgi:hypothetical protein